MQALRHLDKQFMVLPVFMLVINSACYSIAAYGDYHDLNPSPALPFLKGGNSQCNTKVYLLTLKKEIYNKYLFKG